MCECECEQFLPEVHGRPFETVTMDEYSRIRARLPLEKGPVRAACIAAATDHPQVSGNHPFVTVLMPVSKSCKKIPVFP